MVRDACGTGFQPVARQAASLPCNAMIAAMLLVAAFLPLPARAQQPAPLRFWDGHAAAIYAVAWSADGKTVVSGGADRTLRVWDAETGKGIRTIDGFARPVLSAGLSPDGTRLAAGDAGGTLKIFDTPLTRPAAELGTLNNRPTALAVAPDASWLVSGDAGGGVRLWPLPGAAPAKDFAGATGEVTAVTVLPQIKQVLAATADGSLCAWKIDDATATGRLMLPRSGGLAVLPDGLVAAGGEDGVLRIVAWPPSPAGAPIAHNDQVNAVAYSSDGRLLATASNDAIVRVLAAGGNDVARTLSIGTGAVTSVAFSFDNQSVVAGTQAGAVRIWSAADGADRGSLAGHAGAVRSVAAHPKAGQLASAGDDGMIRLWDMPLPARAMAGHAQAIHALAVSADGAVAVTVSADKTARVWSLDRAAASPELKRFDLPEVPTAVAAGRDGKRLAVGDAAGTIRTLDVARGETGSLPNAQPGGVTAIDLHPQQPIVLSGGPDGTVKLWDVSASPPKPLAGRQPIATEHKRVSRVVFTPNGQQFLTAGEDGKVRLWDMAGKLVRPYANCWSAIRWMAVSPDGRLIAAASDPSTNNKSVYVWNFGDGTLKREIATPAGAGGLSFSADGTRLAVGAPEGRVRVYRLDDGLLLEEIALPAAPLDALFAADQRTIVAAVGATPVQTRQSLLHAVAGHVGPVAAVVYSPDGTRLFSAGTDKTIRQWDPPTGKEVRRLSGAAEAAVSLAASEEGNWVAAGGGDKSLRLWQVFRNSPKEVPPSLVLPQPAVVRSVALSRDGRCAAAGCEDQQVRTWDTLLGCALDAFPGHAGPVLAVAFSPDGKTLASGSSDRSARRWARSVVRAAKAHNGPVRAVALLPGAGLIVTAGDDRAAAAWTAADLRLVRRHDAGDRAIALAADPAGRWFAAAAGREVRLWDAAGKPGASLALPAQPAALALADDGRRLIVGGADGAIRHYALAAAGAQPAWGLVLEAPAHPDSVAALALAADGRTLFSAGADKAVKRWVAAATLPRAEIAAHRGPVFALQFHPDGSKLATVGGDRAARIWEANPGRLVAELGGHAGQVLDVAYSADGKRLATCGTDRAVRVFEAGGNLVRTLQDGAADGLAAATFSPDGNWIAAAGLGGKWYAWGAADGRPQRAVAGHHAPLARIAVNRAGSKVATLDLAGQLFVFTADGAPVWHHQLPVTAAYALAWSPDGKQMVLGTSDKRLLALTLPPAAQ